MFRKLFKVYVIYKDNSQEKVLCVCTKKREVTEFIRKYYLVTHFEHFKSWCELHNYNVKSQEATNAYIDISASDSFTFPVIAYWYDVNSLAGLLRMINNYVPVGCSFETENDWQSALTRCGEFLNNYKNHPEDGELKEDKKNEA